MRNAFQTSKKAALGVHINQKDLLLLASAYRVVHSHTQYCLTKPHAESSAELNDLILKIHTGKHAYRGKSKNVIKCSLLCSKEM